MSDSSAAESLWTVPNVISGLRLLGLFPLLWAAHHGWRGIVVGILVFLLASDWIDGKLAILLDQETVFGARLDSAVDTLMYLAIALSFWWLEGDAVRAEIGWFFGVLGAWLLSVAVAMARFRRMPSYHTWGAKTSWLVVGTVAVLWLLTGSPAAVPWALGLVIAVLLEEAAIGCLLPEWRANVPTVVHAVRIRRGEHGGGGAGRR